MHSENKNKILQMFKSNFKHDMQVCNVMIVATKVHWREGFWSELMLSPAFGSGIPSGLVQEVIDGLSLHYKQLQTLWPFR